MRDTGLVTTKQLNRWYLGARFCAGGVWLYEGLWMKILRPDPHELDIVRHFSFLGLGGADLMKGIGALECLLALGFFSGLIPRSVGIVGSVALLAMNLTGIFAGGGTIAAPLGLLIKNTPLWFCMLFYALGTRDRE
ncbi:hypothetical protein EON80_19665 [bacterium]|nr:MAG: hypothetical protein EON80_19665 [bacterium]